MRLRTQIGLHLRFPHASTPGFCYVIYVLCLSCFRVCSLQPVGHLLGKGWPFGSLVCDVFNRFCHFPMWCPGSGVVLDCIDS